MATTPYSLTDNYTRQSKVSASDLNRRALVVASQLPAALLCASLTEGVLPLLLDDEDATGDLAAIATGADLALKVTASAGTLEISPGAALVRHPDGHLVFVWSNETQTLSMPQDGEGWLHLMLLVPEDITEAGALDSQTSGECELLWSENETEIGGLALAHRNESGEWNDVRAFTAPVALAREVQNLRARLAVLEGPALPPDPDDPDAPQTPSLFLSQILWSPQDPRNATTVIEEKIANLKAEILEVIETGSVKKFPSETAILADNLAGVASIAFRLDPRGSEIPQMAVVGQGFGMGQNDTPIFSPETDDPRMWPFDPENGMFGPFEED